MPGPGNLVSLGLAGQGRVEAHQLLGSRQAPPSPSGVLILPASAIHPLSAACSHCSYPLTYHPLKSLLSHSPPVQWTMLPKLKKY